MDKLLTVREAAQVFQVSEKTIRDWCRRKLICAVKPGGFAWRIPESELQRVMAGEARRTRRAEQ